WRKECGRNEDRLTLVPSGFTGATAAPPLAASTATGNKPSRSICTSAAPRSATSKIPSTTSPVRRRALYENWGIKLLIYNQRTRKVSRDVLRSRIQTPAPIALEIDRNLRVTDLFQRRRHLRGQRFVLKSFHLRHAHFDPGAVGDDCGLRIADCGLKTRRT